jgi:hypothetical protein
MRRKQNRARTMAAGANITEVRCEMRRKARRRGGAAEIWGCEVGDEGEWQASEAGDSSLKS